ncbi:hypothetical protein KAI78_06615 [bacterium]|nr:hypothetical protein [bacterium]
MIKIEFFRASKTNVKSGDKIIVSGLFSAEQEGKYLIKLYLIGTNVDKDTQKIDNDKKEVFLRGNSPQKVTWDIEIPEKISSRYNFIGYVQWVSKESGDAGILSSYLFTAGVEYDMKIIEHKTSFDEAGAFKCLKIHALNREIEPLNLKIPLIIRNKKRETVFREMYEIILNFEEIIEIDLDPIQPADGLYLKYAITIDDRPVFKSSKIELFPGWVDPTVSYSVTIKDNIYVEERNEISIYLRDTEKIVKRFRYFDLNIFSLENEKWLIALNDIVIFGLDWDDRLSETPLIYDSFKDFLFSFIFYNIFSETLKKEVEIWKMNRVLTSYLRSQLAEDDVQWTKQLNNLDDMSEEIANLLNQIISRDFISNNQYKNINILKKKFYKKYINLKTDMVGITNKEKANFKKAIKKVDKEKRVFKKQFTKIFESIEEEMKVRNVIAATRRYLTYKVKRSSNKTRIGESTSFIVAFKNESPLNSLPVLMTVHPNPGVELEKPEGGTENVLVLPENFSGWQEGEVIFTATQRIEGGLEINIDLDIGV